MTIDFRTLRRAIVKVTLVAGVMLTSVIPSVQNLIADDSLAKEASWSVRDDAAILLALRQALDEIGVAPGQIDGASESFAKSTGELDADALDAYVFEVGRLVPAVGSILESAQIGAHRRC